MLYDTCVWCIVSGSSIPPDLITVKVQSNRVKHQIEDSIFAAIENRGGGGGGGSSRTRGRERKLHRTLLDLVSPLQGGIVMCSKRLELK